MSLILLWSPIIAGLVLIVCSIVMLIRAAR